MRILPSQTSLSRSNWPGVNVGGSSTFQLSFLVLVFQGMLKGKGLTILQNFEILVATAILEVDDPACAGGHDEQDSPAPKRE